MTSIEQQLYAWADDARQKLGRGEMTEGDLDDLLARVEQARGRPRSLRQRLLYLHANAMTILSQVIAFDLREPTRQPNSLRLCPHPRMPYETVHDALVDGWRIVQFPPQTAPIEDREISNFGYEFILEKMEEYDD